LPDVVRRLESDAKTLRGEIDRLDSSIADLDGDARASMPSAIADSPHEARIRENRDQLRGELRATREHATDSLATTVAALENIRLDLLRLQLGDGQVASVTASLEAARTVAADLSARADAHRELDELLRDHPTPPSFARG
jgi:hypothetical protein